MTEERIGGISVGIEGTYADFEAAVDAAIKIAERGAKTINSLLGDFSIGGSVRASAPAGGAPRQSPSDEKLVTAINELVQALQQAPTAMARQAPVRRRAEEETVTFGSGARGGAEGTEWSRLFDRINAAQGISPSASAPTPIMRERAPAPSGESAAFIDALAKEAGGMTDGVRAFVAALSEVTQTLSSLPVAALASASPSGGGGGRSRAAQPATMAEQEMGYMAGGTRNRAVGVVRGATYSFEPEEPDTPSTGGRFSGTRQSAADQLLAKVGATIGRRASGPVNQMDYEYHSRPAPSRPTGETASPAEPSLSPPPGMTGEQQRAQEANRLRQLDRNEGSRRGTPQPRAGGSPQHLSDEDVWDPRQMRGIMGAQSAYAFRSAQIARAEESSQTRKEADILLQGRTSRTGASSLAGFVLGGRSGLTEAQTGYQISERETSSAARYKKSLDDIINSRRLEIELDEKGGKGQADAWASAARGTTTYRKAVSDVTEAEGKQANALKEVHKYTEGAIPAMRNLFAVTIGGAAFGAGLAAFSSGVKAAEPVIEHLADVQTGYSITAIRTTTALAEQTAAMQGNARAAVLAAEAQAGISESAAQAINPQLTLTTQIKAGAAAMTQASDLFRAAYGAGGAPTGLYGGYGGIAGTQFGAPNMGFTERISQDWQTMGGKGGNNPLADLGTGWEYLTNSDYRKTVNDLGDKTSPGPLTGAPDILGGIGDVLFTPFGMDRPGTGAKNTSRSGLFGFTTTTPETPPQANATQTAYINELNSAISRGNTALKTAATAHYEYTTSIDKENRAAESAALAGDAYSASLAKQGLILVDNTTQDVASKDQYRQATTAAVVGQGMPDLATVRAQASAVTSYQMQLSIAQQKGSVINPDYANFVGPLRPGTDTFTGSALQQQQAQALPGILAQIDRTFSRTLNTTNPAQAALSYFANPPTPVGTGIAPRNAQEQSLVSGSLSQAAATQRTLNTYYEQGYNILRDTYHVSSDVLDAMKTTGQQMTQVQAGISNRDAALQAQQYSYQLTIAKQQMGDISGLAGVNLGYGQTQIGILERQNLLLGRQSQQLGFQLQQRQLNFQIATAGFMVPGQTPAQQAANVKEAKIETGIQQQQLNLSKQQFGNQVQIVDMSNLRAAHNMVLQIGLLAQGRKVSLLDAADSQRLARLAAQQKVLEADIGAYMTKADALVQTADQFMQQYEASAGIAIGKIAQAGIIAATQVGQAFWTAATGGFLASTAGGGSSAGHNSAPPTRRSNASPVKAAGGALFDTSGATHMVVGEAGAETVAVLRNPRSVTAGAMGGGGGPVTINFGDVHIGSEADMNTLTRKMVVALGRDAALRGLRTPN